MDILKTKWKDILTDNDENFLQDVDRNITDIVEIVKENTLQERFYILLGFYDDNFSVITVNNNEVIDLNTDVYVIEVIDKMYELQKIFVDYKKNTPFSVRVMFDNIRDSISSFYSYDADEYTISYEDDYQAFVDDIISNKDNPFVNILDKPDVRFEEV